MNDKLIAAHPVLHQVLVGAIACAVTAFVIFACA
jgi:hypothetical protein